MMLLEGRKSLQPLNSLQSNLSYYYSHVSVLNSGITNPMYKYVYFYMLKLLGKDTYFTLRSINLKSEISWHWFSVNTDIKGPLIEIE